MNIQRSSAVFTLFLGTIAYGGVEIRVKEVLKDEAHARAVCERLCARRKMVHTGHSCDSRQGKDGQGKSVSRSYSCSCFCELPD